MGGQLAEIYAQMNGPIGFGCTVICAIAAIVQVALAMRVSRPVTASKPREALPSTRRRGAYFRSDDDDAVYASPSIWSTLWILALSIFGIMCLGVAAAAYQVSQTMSHIGQTLEAESYTLISLAAAILGLILTTISTLVIMRRLGGLRD